MDERACSTAVETLRRRGLDLVVCYCARGTRGTSIHRSFASRAVRHTCTICSERHIPRAYHAAAPGVHTLQSSLVCARVFQQLFGLLFLLRSFDSDSSRHAPVTLMRLNQYAWPKPGSFRASACVLRSIGSMQEGCDVFNLIMQITVGVGIVQVSRMARRALCPKLRLCN